MVTRHSCRTVKPPTPESNTPTGRESTRRFYERLTLERDGAVLGELPVRVVRDLPGMAFGVDERAGVAAPERRPAVAGDRASRGADLGQDRVHLLRRVRVVGERDPAPAAAAGDHGVARELLPR